jgi:hypothetical protein
LSNKRPLYEAPWLIGVVVGLIGLWWRGHAFVPTPYISAYDWMEYVPSAWMVTHGVDLGGYATWRNPLYPYILGNVGEIIGYNEATWVLSSVAMSTVVIAAGLGARAMANPWAGMVAAITVPLINPWAEASRWATLYPMLTATTGLALALGATHARWGHRAAGLGAAAAAGLALGIDFRGIALVVAVMALLALGTHRHRDFRGTALAILLLGVGPMLNQSVAVTHQKSTATAVHTQRALEVELAVNSGNIALARACRNEPVDEAYPSLATLSRPCARAFAVDNLDRFKDQAPFGVGATLLLMPLLLLGGGRGWRASLTKLMVFGAAFGAMGIMSVWARLNVHHFVQFAAPIAMVVPVAILGALDSLAPARLRSVVGGITSLIAVAYLLVAGPWAGKPIDDLAKGTQSRLLGKMLAGVNLHLDTEGGDILLDCSGLGIEAALLPKRLNPGAPHFKPSALGPRCQSWMDRPPKTSGRSWLITRQEPGFNGPPAPPWVMVEAWVDGPRKTWMWMRVDSQQGQP